MTAHGLPVRERTWVLIEKVTAGGAWIARATGVVLTLWGGSLLARVFV